MQGGEQAPRYVDQSQQSGRRRFVGRGGGAESERFRGNQERGKIEEYTDSSYAIIMEFFIDRIFQ